MRTIFLLLLLLTSFLSKAQGIEIFVSDAGNFSSPPWQILKFDQNGQNPVTFIHNNLNWPQDILFVEDSGWVLISNLGSGRITKHNATTGTFISDFATGIGGPTRMKIGADSLLYVLQWNGNGKVLRYSMDGSFVDEFTSIGVPQSIGIDWDAGGNLCVSSYSGKFIRKFDSNGVDMGLFVSTGLLGPTNIWFDPNGDLLVSDYNGSSVKRFDNSGNFIGDFITGLGQSEGIAFFPNGNILIGNGATNSVKMYDSNGVFIQDLVPAGSGNLLNPNAIVIRPGLVSMEEPFISTKNIMYPSIGSEFYISPGQTQNIQQIDLVNLSGSYIVYVDQPAGNKPINLSHLAEGMYTARIVFSNEKFVFQKLVILK